MRADLSYGPSASERLDLYLQYDRPLTPEEAGADITFDDAGRSVITVIEPRVYAAVELPLLSDRVLRLRSSSADFAIFSVTFGAYTTGA